MEEGKEPERPELSSEDQLKRRLEEIRKGYSDPQEQFKMLEEAMEQSGLYRRNDEGILERVDDTEDEEKS